MRVSFLVAWLSYPLTIEIALKLKQMTNLDQAVTGTRPILVYSHRVWLWLPVSHRRSLKEHRPDQSVGKWRRGLCLWCSSLLYMHSLFSGKTKTGNQGPMISFYLWWAPRTVRCLGGAGTTRWFSCLEKKKNPRHIVSFRSWCKQLKINMQSRPASAP